MIHMRLDIRGSLRNRSFKGWADSEGKAIHPDQVEMELKRSLAEGLVYLPVGRDCPNFSFTEGCQCRGDAE